VGVSPGTLLHAPRKISLQRWYCATAKLAGLLGTKTNTRAKSRLKPQVLAVLRSRLIEINANRVALRTEDRGQNSKSLLAYQAPPVAPRPSSPCYTRRGGPEWGLSSFSRFTQTFFSFRKTHRIAMTLAFTSSMPWTWAFYAVQALLFGIICYRRLFHPLHAVPDPFLPAVTRLYL
jgi:hypothetical protein